MATPQHKKKSKPMRAATQSNVVAFQPRGTPRRMTETVEWAASRTRVTREQEIVRRLGAIAMRLGGQVINLQIVDEAPQPAWMVRCPDGHAMYILQKPQSSSWGTTAHGYLMLSNQACPSRGEVERLIEDALADLMSNVAQRRPTEGASR